MSLVSTAMGERLDPEAVRQTMTRFFDLVRGVVERHGGMVEKYIGDAVMAVFGLPMLHEDDALRAVRAAAEIRDRVSQGAPSGDFQVRIGVNTGEVVAGDPASGQRLVTGDAVNTAARLEQAASTGEILLGAATHHLVRASVSVAEVAPIDAKGKAEPVRAWRLLSVELHGEVAPRRLDAPLVGRERELTRLQRSFGDAVADGRCGLFTLLGPAGVGKSRLVHEFVAGIADRATVIRGRCLPYGEGITFWPIGEIVRAAAGIDETDEREAAIGKIAALLEDEAEAGRIGDLVAAAIGLRDGDADRDQVFWAIRRLFESLAGHRPLVAVIDDLQWAEPTLMDLVEHIADWSRGAPILLLVIARPDLLDVRPGWGGGKIDATTVLLEPLSDDDARVLTERLLAGSLHAGLVARVTDAAEGNPLFVEQIVAMLAEREAQPGDAIEIPPTIQALLAARLDRVPAGERRLAERASVVGRVFDRVAVAELSPAEERAGVTEGLRDLIRRELIRPDPASRLPDDTFRFRHLLIRDAAYDGLSKRDRAELHARFADWLEETAGDRLVESEEIIGYHFEQAHQYRLEIGAEPGSIDGLATRAAVHLLRAGRRAFERDDLRAAVSLYERARALSRPDDPAVVAELPLLGIGRAAIGDMEGAVAIHRDAQALGRTIGDRSAELRGRILEVDVLRQTTSLGHAEARSVMASIIPEAIAIGDHFAAARALSATADMDIDDGLMASALDASIRGLEQARAAGHRRETARQIHGIIIALVAGPTPIDEALVRCNALVRDAALDPIFEALVRCAQAEALARSGDALGARGLIAAAQAAVEQFGFAIPIGIVAYELVVVAHVLGDPLMAERAARSNLDAMDRAEADHEIGLGLALLAEALWAQGRQAEARSLADQASESGCQLGAMGRAAFHRSLARIVAADGEAEGAESHLAEAEALLAPSDALGEKGELAFAGAQVAAVTGRIELARERAAEAETLFERKGDVSSGRRVGAFRAQHAIPAAAPSR